MKQNRNKKGQFISFPKKVISCAFCKKGYSVLINSVRKFCSFECYVKSRIGEKRSLYIGRKISSAKKGKVIISEKQKEQIRKALTGRKLSKEHCKHISEANIKLGRKPPQATSEQHQSIKWRDNISRGLLGRKLSEKHRKKISGKNASNWKGGITPINEKVRHGMKFRLWREEIYLRDNWICQKCKIQGGNLCPHHIRNFAEAIELRFSIDNGITLCQNCHKEFHHICGVKNNTREQLKEFIR